MCRFLTYSGRPLLMHDLLYEPKNSLIKQSIKANEAVEPLNGDGFGIGWYNNELDDTPGLYTSTRPAWNDRNLGSLAKKIKSNLFFAHVRAANSGEVSEANCHPFTFKNFMFMHNGEIEDFHLIKRYLRREVSDEIYNWIRGQTDSEHIFALVLHILFKDHSRKPTTQQMMMAMTAAIQKIIELKKVSGNESDNYINCSFSDGENTICLRYVTHDLSEASTLYYSEGSSYECHEGVCRMRSPRENEPKSVLVVSEKLTNVDKDWCEVPVNHFIVIDKNQNISIHSFDSIVESFVKKAA